MLSESREDLSISVIGMDYPQFMGAIMSRSEEDSSWRTLLDADLIVGGAALNEDFMFVVSVLTPSINELHLTRAQGLTLPFKQRPPMPGALSQRHG